MRWAYGGLRSLKLSGIGGKVGLVSGSPSVALGMRFHSSATPLSFTRTGRPEQGRSCEFLF